MKWLTPPPVESGVTQEEMEKSLEVKKTKWKTKVVYM